VDHPHFHISVCRIFEEQYILHICCPDFVCLWFACQQDSWLERRLWRGWRFGFSRVVLSIPWDLPVCLSNRAGLLLTAETRGTFCPPRLPLFMVCPWGSDPHTSHNASSIVKLGPILHVIVQSSLGRQQGQNTERGGQREKKKRII